MRCLISAFLLLSWAIPSAARTITVDDDGPADFDNIQAAINDANDGDEVVVKDGTYTGSGNRDIDFLGKAIIVRSENGPDNCVIDCEGSEAEPHRGFYFHNSEDTNSLIDGLAITNGYVEGGIWTEHSGGGIFCQQAGLTIKNSRIINCITRQGGGIFCNGGTTIINQCTISNNSASYGGGGICCDGGCNMTITQCVISNNSAGAGGGASCMVNSGAISDCIFEENSGGEFGGGLLCASNVNIKIVKCIFRNNRTEIAFGFGGGICTMGEDASPEIENCTFYNNYAGTAGGGIATVFCNSIPAKVRNCIIWGNTPEDDPGAVGHNAGGKCMPAPIQVDYSILQGAWKSGGSYPYRWKLEGENNIVADPCFADPCDGDYHLKSQAGRWDPNSESWVTDANTSIAIDAGDMSDPVGYEPFPNGGIINMGAYGGTVEASKSYFGTTPCETIVAGDINGDCKVDFLDFALMGFHWLEDNRP